MSLDYCYIVRQTVIINVPKIETSHSCKPDRDALIKHRIQVNEQMGFINFLVEWYFFPSRFEYLG